ncbi:MAG: B-box zinc finger protein [Candidatus Hodarchaeota archaeon]
MVSDYDHIQGLPRLVILVTTLSYSILTILIGLRAVGLSIRARKTMNTRYFYSLSIFFIFLGIARLVLMYHDYIAPDSQDVLLWRIGNVMMFIGVISLNYIIESQVFKKTKYLFTIIGVITGLLHIILEKELATLVMYGGIGFSCLLPILIYISIIKNASGEIRKRTFIFILGILIMLSGASISFFELGGLMEKITVSVIAPFFWLAGLAIAGYGLIRITKPIEEDASSEIKGSAAEMVKLLGLDLTKPEDLTQEDVAFYREKTVCLVCKTEMAGFVSIFFCPECKALYCDRCARALSELENACWSCDKAIDITKPVSIPKDEITTQKDDQYKKVKKQ